MKIKEIIVVEGRDDTTRVQWAVNADTIETNGSEISKETIERIRKAQELRGVIIFTDPDFPGEKIRKIISQAVPGCKHAFLARKDAITKKGLGVEHASKEAIRKALESVYEEQTEEYICEVTQEDVLRAGLIGLPQSNKRREKLGVLLKIGYVNGKQLLKRIKMFQITKQQFDEAVSKLDKEEM